jgi:hypothetical protein
LSAAKQQLRIAETLQCAASSFQRIWIMEKKRKLAGVAAGEHYEQKQQQQ